MSNHLNLLLILPVLLGLQACTSTRYVSQAANTDMRIDGHPDEWAGRFEIPKGEDFAMGISHDKNYLYVAINSMDRTFERQLAMRGLTIWVDARGKERETLGVRFQSLIPMDRHPGTSGNRSSSNSDTDRQDLFRTRSPFKGDLDLIVVDGSGRERLGPADLLATAMAGAGGLVLEYQIPLALLGEDYEAGQRLGVGLSSEFHRSNLPAGSRGGMSGGGLSAGGRGAMSGGGKRGGGHSGGQPGMQGRPDQTDLDVWFKVEFAQP